MTIMMTNSIISLFNDDDVKHWVIFANTGLLTEDRDGYSHLSLVNTTFKDFFKLFFHCIYLSALNIMEGIWWREYDGGNIEQRTIG